MIHTINVEMFSYVLNLYRFYIIIIFFDYNNIDFNNIYLKVQYPLYIVVRVQWILGTVHLFTITEI